MTVNNHLFRRSSRAHSLLRKSLLLARAPKRPVPVMHYVKAKGTQRHLVGYPVLDELNQPFMVQSIKERADVRGPL